MSDLDTHSRVSLSQADRLPADETETSTDVCQCLVVSTSEAMRDMLAEAANRGGWNTIVCSDDQNALSAFRRTRFQMSFVDLDRHGKTPSGFRDLCASLVTQPEFLLVICGNEADPTEEVWARQLGVWLYLPGVTIDHAEELATICEQAQLVASGPPSPRIVPQQPAE